jgi:hypothetical protein
MLEERLGSAGEDAREVRRVDERDDDADESRAAGREASCTAIGGVAVLADDARDEVACLVRDVAASVENARDGRDRDTCLIGDLPNGRTL